MSLIESFLSVVIILATTVLTMPVLLQTRDDYVLNTVAHDVATRMHGARMRAISQDLDCRLQVTSATSYIIECEETVWIIAESVDLPRGFTIAANARPEFHRLGNVAPAATVTLRNLAGRQRSVIVNTGGRIRIQ